MNRGKAALLVAAVISSVLLAGCTSVLGPSGSDVEIVFDKVYRDSEGNAVIDVVVNNRNDYEVSAVVKTKIMPDNGEVYLGEEDLTVGPNEVEDVEVVFDAEEYDLGSGGFQYKAKLRF